MTFTEIVTEVADRLILTSSTATTRIGREVNQRYRRVTSALGLITSRRGTVTQVTVSGTQTLTFTGIEKIITVSQRTGTVDRFLEEVSVEELVGALEDNPSIPSDSLPEKYAIELMGATTVRVRLSSIPNSIFTLHATGHIPGATLAGATEPVFGESFHDILIHGALADEYKKMEKVQLALDAEKDFDDRLSDLKMWIAKSSMQDIVQGKFGRTGARDISRGIQ